MTQKIQIQYEELEDISRKVGDAERRVDDLLTKARLCITMMDDGAWVGRGSDKYRAEMEGRTIPALRKLLEALGETRYKFLRAGDMFRDAEIEATRLIERLPEITGSLNFGSSTGLPINRPSSGGGGTRPTDVGGSRPGGAPSGDLGGTITPELFPDVFPETSGGGSSPSGTGSGTGSDPFGIDAFDPRIPDFFTLPNGETVERPDWFTEFSDEVDGFNGAVNGVALIVGGDRTLQDFQNNLVSESVAAGGQPVSGMFVSPENLTRESAERAASAAGGFLANNPNAQIKLSPGLQALINGVATDSLGRSLMDNMPNAAQMAAMRQFIEILKTTAEAFGRVLPFV